MKQFLGRISVIILTFCAFKAQGYTFTVQNFTNKQHKVAIQLKGLGQKPSDAQTVEPYGAQPQLSIFSQVLSKAKGWVKDIQKDLSDKLDKLSKSTAASNTDTLLSNLSELQDDIENKIKAGVLKVGAKDWVNDLNALKNDVRSAAKNLDRTKIANKLAKLQSEMSTKLEDLSNAPEESTELDTVKFKFGGLRIGLCASKVFVDGKQATIYGIYDKVYDHTRSKFVVAGNKDAFKDLIKKGRYFDDLTKALLGVCFTSRFEIVELNNGEIAVVTRIVPIAYSLNDADLQN